LGRSKSFLFIAAVSARESAGIGSGGGFLDAMAPVAIVVQEDDDVRVSDVVVVGSQGGDGAGGTEQGKGSRMIVDICDCSRQ